MILLYITLAAYCIFEIYSSNIYFKEYFQLFVSILADLERFGHTSIIFFSFFEVKPLQ